MKSQTGKIFSFVIALCILLSVFCFASTQVNAAMPEDYNKSGAGPAKIDALKEPLKGKAVSLIQAVRDANAKDVFIDVAPGIVVGVHGGFLDLYTVTGKVISQTENKIVFRVELLDKVTGAVMSERLPEYVAIYVEGFPEGTAYSVGEDGVWHKIVEQEDLLGLGRYIAVRPGYEIVVVK